ncbi:uroporphyrinogen-III synthase [Pseudoxanthomonas kalamensis DSM 18571]|uniref:uroporphyrinogen-III synthase n=1 Tax=Pseudoxanthomonas kalamensis TaxID=289483 RepID=UPI0013910CC6|nr:uroporphyrinogen-III synthase [Pseudoxanthomonas kalamensis]KAF1712200.1 uroporphyrinogen-III synthase [Pseudoxanthomonas kalamensis DSM 18571]
MAPISPPGWYVISLRPQGGHAGLRAAAARRGGGLLALSPWRLQGRDDRDTRHALRNALAADRVLFTSPAAVRHAAALATLKPRRGQVWIAVGSGTATALRRFGIDDVIAPARMDSEGLLDLPQLRGLRGHSVGLVTAPQGREALAPALRRRGARVLRADVYERIAIVPAARARQRLRELDRPACVALSSGGALQALLAVLVPPERAALLRIPAIVASERLAAQARAAGFRRVRLATGPRPAQLASAAAEAIGVRFH